LSTIGIGVGDSGRTLGAGLNVAGIAAIARGLANGITGAGGLSAATARRCANCAGALGNLSTGIVSSPRESPTIRGMPTIRG
jgi:hypothetical protein